MIQIDAQAVKTNKLSPWAPEKLNLEVVGSKSLSRSLKTTNLT
jgi:hypothetical protein